jgi:DNA helicase-2/ATP-dependent DNA helicase PcrA
MKDSRPSPDEKYKSSPPEDPYSLSEGDKVVHERFGSGLIIEISGEVPNTTALVDFENDGKKKLLLRFAKLRKI